MNRQILALVAPDLTTQKEPRLQEPRLQKEPGLRPGASRRPGAFGRPGASLQQHERVHRSLASFLPVVAVLDRGVFGADLRGTRRLLGEPEHVARRALERVSHEAGVSLAAGIASVPFVARVVSERTPPGAVRVLAPGEERAFLAALPLAALPLDQLVQGELELLGLHTVGDFAALPRGSVLDRFGWAAAHAHALACREDPDALAPTPPPKRFAVARRWDDGVDGFEPLLFALRTAVEELAASLVAAGFAVLRLGARLEREKEAAGPGPGSNALALPVHGSATRSKSKRVGVATKALPPGRSSVEKEAGLPAVSREDDHPLRFERLVLPPSADAKALLRSLRWMLEERRDIGRVSGVALEALSVEPLRGRQLGLFAPDGARREDALGVAAYLRARLGPGRVLQARVADPEARLPERRVSFEEVVS